MVHCESANTHFQGPMTKHTVSPTTDPWPENICRKVHFIASFRAICQLACRPSRLPITFSASSTRVWQHFVLCLYFEPQFCFLFFWFFLSLADVAELKCTEPNPSSRPALIDALIHHRSLPARSLTEVYLTRELPSTIIYRDDCCSQLSPVQDLVS